MTEQVGVHVEVTPCRVDYGVIRADDQKVSPYRKMSPCAVKSLGLFLNTEAQPLVYTKQVQTAKDQTVTSISIRNESS